MENLNCNQTGQTYGTSMPLLMNFTNPTKIQEEENSTPIIYDPIAQTVLEMRTVGTYSLKTRSTRKGNLVLAGFDKKNEIDDQKNVK
jgi:hypothetical protein